jgi:hypothetical protein
VTARGSRGETGKAPEVLTHQDTVDDGGAEKTKEEQDFKSSCGRPLYFHYD